LTDAPRPTLRLLDPEAGGILTGSPESLRQHLAQQSAGHSALWCGHTGASMNPALDSSDLLEVLPYKGRAPQPGDVILFVPMGREQAVVHRVIEVSPLGIRCRGDGNRGDDPWLLQPADVIGQVVAAQRGKRRRKVTGGRRGHLGASVVRWRRRLDRRLSAVLRPLYRGVARTAIVSRMAPAGCRPRVVAFKAGNKQFLRLMVGQRVVGRMDPETRQWRIRRPFRLLVDDGLLRRESGIPE
jgi:hypothetical protein